MSIMYMHNKNLIKHQLEKGQILSQFILAWSAAPMEFLDAEHQNVVEGTVNVLQMDCIAPLHVHVRQTGNFVKTS